jgi:uncharacterized protein
VPGTSLLTLIDDVAALLDDVSVMTKVAAKKTAGVLGDDLALNAQQVAGVATNREIPVVWAVAKGSALNKLIIVPAALAISALAPWAVIPLLMIGGAYLCFEGVEKLWHRFFHRQEEEEEQRAHVKAVEDPTVDIVAFEKAKIRGAIRTDVVLSAEIIVIALGTVADAPFNRQVAVLSTIAVLMTVGVYGFVAGIVKLDDAGLALSRRSSAVARALGRGILVTAPVFMKLLGIAGTVAMFLVGGGILAHGIPPIHHLAESLAAAAGAIGAIIPTLIDGLTGVVAGAILVAGFNLVQRVRQRFKKPPAAGEKPPE